jgi:hypothetical protein
MGNMASTSQRLSENQLNKCGGCLCRIYKENISVLMTFSKYPKMEQTQNYTRPNDVGLCPQTGLILLNRIYPSI